MLKKMQIDKLFNRFNYTIVFNTGITILTGPNGFGKSTILNIIEALSQKDLYFLFDVKFKKMVLWFDNFTLEIEKKDYDLILNELIFKKDIYAGFIDNEIFRRNRPYLRRVNEDTWFDRRSEQVYKRGELQDTFFYNMLDSDEFELDEDELSKEHLLLLEKIKNEVRELYFIKDQRLIKQKRIRRDRFENDIIDVIEQIPDKMKALISEISNKYSDVANQLDSSYPSRLFETEIGISEADYEKSINDMKQKFEKLGKYDISEMKNISNVSFKEEHAKALKIYFEDFDLKYEVYKKFINQLDMFTDMINNRLHFKSLRITRNEGITLIDDNKNSIKLSSLSSGEKQEIVMFFELIFSVSEGVLLLIDEPEISLHIAWQKIFMDDLERIVQMKKINVIVATHSPQIISNHWDKQIDLGELYSNEFNKK